MPDAGSIGTYQTLAYAGNNAALVSGASATKYQTLAYVRNLPIWAEDYRGLINVAVTGTISGTVKVNNALVSNYLVRVYYRKNGLLARSGYTNSSGAFSFTDLDPTDKYTVIAFDDINQSPDYNSQVFDLLTPV